MPVKDIDGEVLGQVSSFEIDPEKLRVEAIFVDRGFFAIDVLVGREYIKRIGQKYVWLNIDLTMFIKGKTVIDAEGNELGSVSEVDRVKKSNKLAGLRVETSSGLTYFNHEKIKEIRGDKVFLKRNI